MLTFVLLDYTYCCRQYTELCLVSTTTTAYRIFFAPACVRSTMGCRIFRSYCLKGTSFGKHKYRTRNAWLDFLFNFGVYCRIGKNPPGVFINTLRFHARCLIFVPILTKFIFILSTVMKVTNIKFYESQSREG